MVKNINISTLIFIYNSNLPQTFIHITTTDIILPHTMRQADNTTEIKHLIFYL